MGEPRRAQPRVRSGDRRRAGRRRLHDRPRRRCTRRSVAVAPSLIRVVGRPAHLSAAHRAALRARGRADRGHARGRRPARRRGATGCGGCSASRSPTTRTASCRTCTGRGGAFGYFPSYALGCLIAAQLWEALEADARRQDDALSARETSPRSGCGWPSTSTVHGRRLDTEPLVEAATGRGIDVEPFLRCAGERPPRRALLVPRRRRAGLGRRLQRGRRRRPLPRARGAPRGPATANVAGVAFRDAAAAVRRRGTRQRAHAAARPGQRIRRQRDRRRTRPRASSWGSCRASWPSSWRASSIPAWPGAPWSCASAATPRATPAQA